MNPLQFLQMLRSTIHASHRLHRHGRRAHLPRILTVLLKRKDHRLLALPLSRNSNSNLGGPRHRKAGLLHPRPRDHRPQRHLHSKTTHPGHLRPYPSILFLLLLLRHLPQCSCQTMQFSEDQELLLDTDRLLLAN